MNPKIKEQWIKALRSGEYKQGTDTLRYVYGDNKDYQYCCLGVLCDLYPEGRWEVRSKILSTGYIQFSYLLDPGPEFMHGHSTELPRDLQESIGISDEDEGILIEMNDQGIPFEKIADWIEENL